MRNACCRGEQASRELPGASVLEERGDDVGALGHRSDLAGVAQGVLGSDRDPVGYRLEPVAAGAAELDEGRDAPDELGLEGMHLRREKGDPVLELHLRCKLLEVDGRVCHHQTHYRTYVRESRGLGR